MRAWNNSSRAAKCALSSAIADEILLFVENVIKKARALEVVYDWIVLQDFTLLKHAA